MTTFAMQIGAFAKKAGDNADLVVRKICLDLLEDIVMHTPVDTGRARANWFTTIGTPFAGTIEHNGAGAAAGVSIGRSGAAISQAPGNVLWISNNLPYINRLEFEGWSKQAPQGMVRIAIDNMNRQMR